MSAHSCNKWCRIDEEFHRIQKDNDWFYDEEDARQELIEWYSDRRKESYQKIEKLEL